MSGEDVLSLSEKIVTNISPRVPSSHSYFTRWRQVQIGALSCHSSSLKRRLGGDVLSLSEKLVANISPNVPSSRSYFTRRRQVRRGVFIVVFSSSLKRRLGGDVFEIEWVIYKCWEMMFYFWVGRWLRTSPQPLFEEGLQVVTPPLWRGGWEEMFLSLSEYI